MIEPLSSLPLFHNVPEFTVSELAYALKNVVEKGFSHVKVRGEIGNFKRHSSGHLYFTLKEGDAVLDIVCWVSIAKRLVTAPEDGLEVICVGRITTYPGRSRYQMVVEDIVVAGAGALLKAIEERKKRLAAEGLFDENRKKPIPYLPQVIGVITSPTGAVIRDIWHRLTDRFPVPVLLWPVTVQGETAPTEIIRALKGMASLPYQEIPRPDVIILARGGGSVEDLMPFNDEALVRAVASCPIPIISAIGHETDFTLVDFAADLRAPTPTGAAEKATKVRTELVKNVLDLQHRLDQGVFRFFDDKKIRIEGLGRGLPEPAHLLDQAYQKLDDRYERLNHCIKVKIQAWQDHLAKTAARIKSPEAIVDLSQTHLNGLCRQLQQMILVQWQRSQEKLHAMTRVLEAVSHQRVLERGFALVHKQDHIVSSVTQIVPEDNLVIQFHDGKTKVKAQ